MSIFRRGLARGLPSGGNPGDVLRVQPDGSIKWESETVVAAPNDPKVRATFLRSITSAPGGRYTVDNPYGWQPRVPNSDNPIFPAQAGDVIQIAFGFRAGAAGDGVDLYTDVHTIVDGSPVHAFSGGSPFSNTGKGLIGIVVQGEDYVGASMTYTVQADDLNPADQFNSKPFLRLSIRHRLSVEDKTKYLYASPDSPFSYSVINYGKAS